MKKTRMTMEKRKRELSKREKRMNKIYRRQEKQEERREMKIETFLKQNGFKWSLIRKEEEPMDTDSSFSTYGCRHGNPESCKYVGKTEACAFVREDEICHRPPINWRKSSLTY